MLAQEYPSFILLYISLSLYLSPFSQLSLSPPLYISLPISISLAISFITIFSHYIAEYKRKSKRVVVANLMPIHEENAN
jgi:hypothetical protein